jgi:ABC-type multidrug transport system ATPase subunit
VVFAFLLGAMLDLTSNIFYSYLLDTGKTTISSILCCEIGGTAGEVRVFGHSVFSDPYSVRGMVGLCKQDDYLWPDLSAKEHLELFAGLRGVESAELPATVQKWLESVDLDTVQDHYSSGFSGGMKRRLSVALATIGDRPLIVLDEPTTGEFHNCTNDGLDKSVYRSTSHLHVIACCSSL